MMDNLGKLIEAVEAGKLDHDGGAYRLFGDKWLHVFDAMNGSLDAAMALHESLLPGCNQASVDWGPSGCGATAVWWPNGLSGDCEIVEKGYDVCPARALLSATLKALRTYRSQVQP